MATMPADESTHALILVPFPAQGHFAAFLSLAARLHAARPAAGITLVSTPRNVAALQQQAASSASAFLRFHALPFVPEEHGLPTGAESADALHPRHFLALFEAAESPALQAAFDAFLAATVVTACTAPVVVVADPFLAWTTAAARRRGARHAFFNSCGAFGSAVYHSLWNHLPHRRRAEPADAGWFRLTDHPEVAVHRSQLPPHLLHADGTDPWSAYHRRQVSLAHDTDAVIVNTAEEFEPAGLRMLRRTLQGAPVLPIGPLVRLAVQSRRGHDDGDGGDSIMRWLDAREPRSVLYVSFGSQNSLLPEQMVELAAALELTGRPFVWAIRPPVVTSSSSTDDAAVGGTVDEWLPAGFEERTGSRGLLVRGWAPQVRILAHASTGAFLSHCGWNSVLESMAHGVPVVGWPLQGDQFFNCRMLEREWGACVEAARGNDEDGMAAAGVDRARLAEAVETALGDGARCAEMRRRVQEIREMLRRALREDGGSSVEALETFFGLMQLQRHGVAAGNER